MQKRKGKGSRERERDQSLKTTHWASLVVQTVKNLPAMLETCFRSLGWEDPLEKGMADSQGIRAWRIP